MSSLTRILLAAACILTCAFSAFADPLDVKPPALDLPDRSGAFGREMRHLCLRQLGADCRDRLVFGTDSYLKDSFTKAEPGKRMSEHQIRPIAALVFASAAALQFGSYDESAVGISRGELARIALSLTRELASHHVSNTDKSSWWWGDEWQSAYWTASVGTGAWMMWDRLPSDTRRQVANMVAHEADRFISSPAPFNEFNDTKCEENAWNSEVMVLAYCMMPSHPNRAAWNDKAKEYMITAYAAPQDLGSSRVIDGKPLSAWLRGPNIHRDYTLENHGFFHPDYLISFYLNVTNMIPYKLAGEPAPEGQFFNLRECKSIYDFMTLPCGWTFYPQSTDWNNYRHDVLVMAQMSVPVLADPVGGRSLRWAIDFLKYADSTDAGKPSKGLFRGQNFNCCPLANLTSVYLMHYLYGSAAKPLSTEQAIDQLAGTRLLEQGKCVVGRSKVGIASFSWFDSGRRLMAAVTPFANDAFALPKFRSLVGHIGKEMDAVNVVRKSTALLPGGGYGVGMELQRGPDAKVNERLMMAALPDGRVIWAEWFDADGAGLGEVRTGLVFFENNPFWLRGAKPRVICAGGDWQQPDEPLTLSPSWLNLGDRMGIVVRGSKTALVEDGKLTLNYLAAGSQDALPKRMVAVFYPGADSRRTADLDKALKVTDLGLGAVSVDLGDSVVKLDSIALAVTAQ